MPKPDQVKLKQKEPAIQPEKKVVKESVEESKKEPSPSFVLDTKS